MAELLNSRERLIQNSNSLSSNPVQHKVCYITDSQSTLTVWLSNLVRVGTADVECLPDSRPWAWRWNMAAHSSILAWKIPLTEEPSRLQSMRSQESDTTYRPPPPPDLELSSSLGLQSYKIHSYPILESPCSLIKLESVWLHRMLSDSHLLSPWPQANAIPATLLLATVGQVTR